MEIRKLLVMRFSALGDVAMTLPVIEAFCRAFPDVQVTMLTSVVGKKIFDAVLSDTPNLTTKGLNLKRDYQGIGGLNRLFSELKKENFDAVCDLHDVLRTKWLTLRFRLQGTTVRVIEKGRDEKNALIHHEIAGPLKAGTIRYQEVFQALGFDFEVDYNGTRTSLTLSQTAQLSSQSIGLAPFAQHKGKIYPKEKMLEVVRQLLQANSELHIYLFGGPDEASDLDSWCAIDPARIHNTAGRQTLPDDIRMMADLKCMISMDSSNMHLASLVGTPVVSIWGATHPDAGFLGYGQKTDHIVQLPLTCRPCSIYGNKTCKFGTWECLEGIRPETIVAKVQTLLTEQDPQAEQPQQA